MKKQLILRNLPTYTDNTEITLNRINLFFGKNGTGKTTLCEYIKAHPELLTENQEDLIVFDNQFKRSQIIDGMKGIYTFGKSDSELIKKIDLNKEKINEKTIEKNRITEKKENTEKQIGDNFEKFKNEVWDVKRELNEEYPHAKIFDGFNNSKDKFAKELLTRFEEYSKEEFDESKISEYYELIKKDELYPIDEYELLNITDVSTIKGFELLSQSIVSHSDNDLNKYYSKLSNLDWVKQGREYLNNEDYCPFCKTKLDNRFKIEFKAIFDEVYDENIKNLNQFSTEYNTYMGQIREGIEKTLQNKHDILNYSLFEARAYELLMTLSEEKELLNEKLKNPSIVISPKNIEEWIVGLNQQLNDFNNKIIEYNKNVSEIKQIPKKLEKELWIKISKKLYDKCNGFNNGYKNLEGQKKEHQESIDEIDENICTLNKEISEMNEQITNIENTTIKMNNLLSNFGFKNFELIVNKDKPGTYSIKRPDGIGKIDTLSEGEFNLISFMYLYELINGGLTPEDGARGVIVVIDDPASSMDGDTMGIISTLTKNIIIDCINEKSRVKQLLVFTHNVFYYKEIEYRFSNNKNKNKNKVAYHTIIKNDLISTVCTTNKSKIHSIYEQLWIELKNNNSPTSTFNCMRRIMEYYFRTLSGSEEYNKVRSELDECDKITFDGLMNMVNSGSHSIFDPIDTYIDETTIEKYKKMFEKIFELSDNRGHYTSMMRLINQNDDQDTT